MKKINFLPNVVKCSKKELFFKISQYLQENNCVGVSFSIKMQTFRLATLFKKTRTQVFYWQYLGKIFKNSSFGELFFSEFFILYCFPTWTNNITIIKYHSQTQLDKKTYLFMMFFLTSLFSISPLHVRSLLPYTIKNNCSEGL